MRSPRWRLARRVTITAAVGLLGTGCGGPDPAAVEWSGRVCTALAGFTTTLGAQPQVPVTDPGAVQAWSTWLTGTAGAVQGTIQQLDGVGPAPVDGGDAYVERLGATLGEIAAGLDTARRNVAGIDPADPRVATEALPAALAPLQQLGAVADPTEGLSGELEAAFAAAPGCEALRPGG